ANVFNDYSDMTRKSFEQWIGRPVLRFPEDIIRFDARPGSDFKRGQLFKPWLEFRSKIIRDFLKEAADAIHKTKPGLQIGAYTGSWYTEYYGTGVNWGSENYRVKTAWATENYNQSGYAEFLDWLSTGCYYPVPYREDARQRKKEEGGTVEAAAELSTMAVDNAIPVYAGLYMINYKDAPADFPRAIQAAIRHSQGVMIFDISHIYDYGWWPYLEQAFAGPATSPHRVPGLNAQLRTARDAARALPDVRVGASRVPAVPFQPGGG
ncbi:MAG: alpha amylase family protein, partial [Chthonomonadales bacterium]